MSEISMDEFQKIDLKVGRVVEAEKVENADKLLKLKVNVGEKEIQLVAGIAKSYDISEIIDKRIIVVANLKPAKVRGILSEGMLLAAVDNEKIVLLTTDRDIDEGAKIR